MVAGRYLEKSIYYKKIHIGQIFIKEQEFEP